MKAYKVRGLSDAELSDTLKEIQRHVHQLRFQASSDRLDAVSEIRKARRDIARILTIRRERELKSQARNS